MASSFPMHAFPDISPFHLCTPRSQAKFHQMLVPSSRSYGFTRI
jgi:hypothetical protein